MVVFHVFFICTIGTKSRNESHIHEKFGGKKVLGKKAAS